MGGGRFWNDQIVLFGTGQMAENFYIQNKDYLKIKFCLDNDRAKQGKTFHDVKIYSPYDKSIDISKYKIVVSSMFYPIISLQFQRMGLKEFENFIPASLAQIIYNKNKKLAIIYGNCHTSIIEEYLSSFKLFSDKIWFYPIPKAYEFGSMNFNSTSISILKNCDLFIYQSDQDINSKTLSSQYFLNILKKDCDCIKITNTHGHAEGFFPQFISNRFNEKGLFPYGDENIAKLVDEGKETNEIISFLKSDNVYTKTQIINRLNYQIEQLSEREKNCNIKIVDYIKANYKKQRMFNDLYHPSNFLLKEFARRILKYLNLYSDEFEKVEINRSLNSYQMPIYPCVARHLELEYKADMGRTPSQNLIDMEFDEYIKEYIDSCYNIE